MSNTIQETTSPPTSEDVEAPASNAGSFESFLRERRAQLQQKQQHEIPVPNFDGRLIGVYHTPSYHELRAIAKRHERQSEEVQELYGSADILINSCDRLYGVGDDGTTADLPKWSIELAKKFGIENPEVDTARKAVLAIFEGQELALVTHSAELLEAIKSTEPKVENELGE